MKLNIASCGCLYLLCLIGCSTTAENSQPVAPTPTVQPLAKKLPAPKPTFAVNASPITRSPESYKDDLMRRGILAIERGDLTAAMECANAMWRTLEEQRAGSTDVDLGSPEIRNTALLLALARARVSRSSDTSLLEKILKANPSWEPAYVVLASILVERGAYLLAEFTTLAALDRVENPSAVVFSLHASALRAQNKNSEARRVIARAAALFPNETVLTHWQGLFEYDNGKLDKACELFEKAFQKEHAGEALIHNQAVCLSRAGRLDDASTVVKQGLSEYPQSARIRLLAGTILKKSGDTEGAESAWRGFLDITPENDKRRAIVQAALSDLRSHNALEPAAPVTPH